MYVKDLREKLMHRSHRPTLTVRNRGGGGGVKRVHRIQIWNDANDNVKCFVEKKTCFGHPLFLVSCMQIGLKRTFLQLNFEPTFGEFIRPKYSADPNFCLLD